jgi:tubulin polyglutamylase TTLL6/13
MLDSALTPYLIEVNQSPSFTTDSPLDDKIKKGVLTDAFNLLNLSVKRKQRLKA